MIGKKESVDYQTIKIFFACSTKKRKKKIFIFNWSSLEGEIAIRNITEAAGKAPKWMWIRRGGQTWLGEGV